MGGGTSTQAHLNARTCNALQRDQEKEIIECGRSGRDLEEVNPHLPEGPNQATLTYLAQQHDTSHMETMSATEVAHGPVGAGQDHTRRCGSPHAAKVHTWARPDPTRTWLCSRGIQTMALSDSDR